MIIIFVVPAGFVSLFPLPPSVRLSLPSGSSFSLSSSLCAPPLPGTGFSPQTRRGVFDKLASPPWNLARFTSGPFLCIRQKAAYAVASVFFALDYSPPARLLLPLALFLFPIFSCALLFFLLVYSFCLSLLPLSSKFDLPPLCVFTLAVVTFINLLLTSSLFFSLPNSCIAHL